MRTTFRGLLGLAAMVAVLMLSGPALGFQHERRELVEELQRQNRAILEQQQRQFEEQQIQRQHERTMDRIGEESRRSPYQRYLDQQIIEMLSPPSRDPRPSAPCPPERLICY